MDVLAGVGQVELNLGRTLFDQQKQTSALASGLRVQSSADAPAGYAIAQTIQTRVGGLQQGVQNVQTANNLLAVANGALESVQLILIRIRSLIVESRSDLESQSQLQSIQAEIQQLLLEINHIATNTNFNGLQLFGGLFDTSAAQKAQVTEITASPNPDGSIGPTQVTNGDGLGNPTPLIIDPGVGPPGYFIQNFLIEFHVTGYSNNAYDPGVGYIGPGDTIDAVAYSTDPAFGAAPQTEGPSAINTNIGQVNAAVTTPLGTEGLMQFTLANLTPNDVGVAQAFVVYGQKAAGQGHALNVNSGGSEGTTVSLTLPQLSTLSLGISAISVLDPQTVDPNTNLPTGQSSSNIYAATDAEFLVSNAITQLGQLQSQIGAQTIALQDDANANATQIVNQIASESSIRDTNVAASVAALTQDRILTQVATSVLAQMHADAHTVTRLLIEALGAASPAVG
ncbi:MAG: flagellin N-terminal helical domain-containing protein [Vulcanimicrobiaceae bacterium]